MANRLNFCHLCLTGLKYDMMHRITFISLLIFSSIISFGQGIEFFEGSWDEALNEAREDDKVI